MIPKHHCFRCGYEWPIIVEHPRKCPNCQRKNWSDCVEVGWAWIGWENQKYPTEKEAEDAIKFYFPDIIFQDWAECNEPEATETEEVRWGMSPGGEPILAMYQE